MAKNNTPAYTVLPEESVFHIVDGNKKVGNKYTLAYSTIPGHGRPTWSDGKVIIDVAGTCGGICDACAGECYALKALKRYANTTACSWGENTVIIRTRPEEMRRAIIERVRRRRRPVKYVRVHVAGDFDFGYSGENELLELVKLANELKKDGIIVYGYTKRTEKLLWYERHYGDLPKNLVIMASQWRNADGVESVTNYTNAPEFHYHSAENDCEELRAMPHCPAVDKNGHSTGVTCEQCGLCQHARKGDKIAVYAH